jgi:DNA-binding transcriptional ArsR family regulator
MDVFAALADPTRRRVLDLLLRRERLAGELADAFPRLSQPAISRHLRVLREAGLVRVRRDEQRRVYSLRPAGLRSLDAWLAHYRHFWTSQLDALSAHLDAARPPATRNGTKGRPRR